MWKMVSVVVLVLFLGANTGIYKFLHYCGEELSSESYINTDNCGCEDEDEQNGCCKDDFKVMQFQGFAPIIKSADFPFPVSLDYSLFSVGLTSLPSMNVKESLSPIWTCDLSGEIPITVLVQNFRI